MIALFWFWRRFTDIVVLTPWTGKIAAPAPYSKGATPRVEVEERFLLNRIGAERRDVPILKSVYLASNVLSRLAEAELALRDYASPFTSLTHDTVGGLFIKRRLFNAGIHLKYFK